MNKIYTNNSKINVIPCDIDQYFYVTQISIISTKISVLPVELFNLVLNLLNLFNNNISVLPREIKKLTQLCFLCMSYNKLKKIPREILYLKNVKNQLWINHNIFMDTDGSVKNQFKTLDENGYID